jgi:hypothetical protein
MGSRAFATSRVDDDLGASARRRAHESGAWSWALVIE